MNILLLLCILIILTLAIYLLQKTLDKLGLLIGITLMNILAFILSFKYTILSNITISTNSIAFISMLTVIYMYYEKTNEKETKKVINEIFIINIIAAGLLYIMSLYPQEVINTVGINIKNVFIDNYRMLIAYPITTLLSSYGMIYIYKKIKNLYDNMFISTTVSFLIIGLLELLLFNLITYLFRFNFKTIIELTLGTYMVRIFILSNLTIKEKEGEKMNTIYLIIELVICFIGIILLYAKYKLEGLYSYLIITAIITTIMSLKTIDFYNFSLNLGLIPYITIFIVSNIIIQKKGTEEIKKIILILLTTSTFSYIIILLSCKLESSPINIFMNKSFDNIFIDSARIYFANIVTTLYMLFLNSKLYYYLKKEKNKIIISNIFSSVIVQFLATIIFILLAYAITTPMTDIIAKMIIRYIISLIVMFLGTIVIYITNNIKEN